MKKSNDPTISKNDPADLRSINILIDLAANPDTKRAYIYNKGFIFFIVTVFFFSRIYSINSVNRGPASSPICG